MRTIVIIGGIILAGATVIAVVQNEKKKDKQQQEVHQPGDVHNNSDETSSTAPATNPAHGVAGHRCDLPVGAPLATASGSAAPVQQPQINMNQVPQQAAPAAPSAPSASGVKMNPAHGMPGHRCDIQVGAPLT